jgi:transmembrane sensor
MDEVILKVLNGDATDGERLRLAQWREASPENEMRFLELESVWDGLGRLTRRRAESGPDVGAMIAEAERRRARAPGVRERHGFVRSWLGIGVAAAACMALVFAGTRVWRGRGASGTAMSSVASSIGVGQVTAMTLSDGSFLRVAQGAHVTFPRATGQREVAMAGRVFFAVAPGREPFAVKTDLGEVTVRGTRFEVRADNDQLRVVVVDGVVHVDGPNGSAEVHPGQVATVRRGDTPRVETVGNVWPLLDWPGGLLVFQRTALEDVAAQLGRQFRVSVRIQDSLAAARRVTGSFHDASLDEVVDAVCAVTGIHCSHEGDVVVLGTPGR